MFYNDDPVDPYQEHCEFNYSTDSEWDRDEALEMGQREPDRAWICTGRDVWHENPFYTGKPEPHPELDIHTDEEYEFWLEGEMARRKRLANPNLNPSFYNPAVSVEEQMNDATPFEDTDIPF